MSGFGKVLPTLSKQPAPLPKEEWWVEKAYGEMGQHEIPGSKDNPRIVYYHSFATLKATDDETPWCSSFMCFVFGGGTRSAAAVSWATWGKPLDQFKRGCIVVMKRSGGHHVTLGLEDQGDTIKCLGGNQSDSVCIANEPKNRVIAYRWPN